MLKIHHGHPLGRTKTIEESFDSSPDDSSSMFQIRSLNDGQLDVVLRRIMIGSSHERYASSAKRSFASATESVEVPDRPFARRRRR